LFQFFRILPKNIQDSVFYFQTHFIRFRPLCFTRIRMIFTPVNLIRDWKVHDLLVVFGQEITFAGERGLEEGLIDQVHFNRFLKEASHPHGQSAGGR